MVRVRTPMITLLTDFGLTDAYVGQMKGVIHGLSPGTQVVDLTHDVPPQDVAEGAFQLATAWEVFPPGTIHLAVVDPGVGTARRPVAFRYQRHVFVMPDNGLGTLVLHDRHPEEAVVLDRGDVHRSQVSNTFHGRDIFVPVAAHLAQGVPLNEVGSPIEPISLDRLALPSLVKSETEVTAPVVSIDRFGNCRTLIRPDHLPGPPNRVRIRCGQLTLLTVFPTYGAVAPGRTLALFGSHGGLELAVRDGNAAKSWGIQRGDAVEVSVAR